MIEVPGGWVLEPGEETPSVEALLARMAPGQIAEAEARMAGLRELESTFEGDTGQTLYSSALDPCPFCGAGSDPCGPRPWVQTSDALSGGWEARVVCGGCHVATAREWVAGPVTYLPTGEDITRLLAVEKAVSSWNRRFAL